jgi:CBS domain-containing protein
MKAGKLCKHPVIVGTRDMTIKDAAALMRAEHVGALVIVDDTESNRPIGMLTDRDIVVGGVALNLDPDAITVEILMTDQPITVKATDTTEQAFARMRLHGARRLPVVGTDGALLGILTMDDLIEDMGKQLANLGKTALRAGEREAKRRAKLGVAQQAGSRRH